MAKLPWAKMSPRIENGVLYWFEGDTFQMNLLLTLKDQDGLTLEVKSNEKLELVFLDKHRDVVKTLVFSGQVASSGAVRVVMDTELSALFPAGRYSYDLRLLGEERTTLIRGGRIVVE